ncbi:MAG: ferrous iron transport protein A [Zoogloeaceae bacterium]|jgi:Fe2+ transport system protein FeoA|nr:ferrous iron transport protein A [Zoogloeaceae bacterium]
MNASQSAAMPLLLAEPGESFQVAAFLHGQPPEPQLAEVGIVIGATLTLVACEEDGVVVAKEDARLALGRAVAQKILVIPVPDKEI